MLVKTSGEWRPTLEWYGKTSGEHRSVRNLYKKVSGSWEEILLNPEAILLIPEEQQPDYIYINLANDTGKTTGSGEVSAWAGIGGTFTASADSSYPAELKPIDDSTYQLNGLNTVRFDSNSSAPYNPGSPGSGYSSRHLYSSNLSTGFTSAPGLSNAFVIRPEGRQERGAASEWGSSCLFTLFRKVSTQQPFFRVSYPYLSNYTDLSIQYPSGAFSAHTEFNIGDIRNKWNVVVVSLDCANDLLRVCVNGTMHPDISVNTSVSSNLNDVALIGSEGGGTTGYAIAGLKGNLAHITAWKIALSADECVEEAAYLKNKYNL